MKPHGPWALERGCYDDSYFPGWNVRPSNAGDHASFTFQTHKAAVEEALRKNEAALNTPVDEASETRIYALLRKRDGIKL